MGAPPRRQAEPEINEVARIYRAAEKLMLGEKVKCRRCLGPLRFDQADGKLGIVCDTGCTRFYLDVGKSRRR